MSQSTVTRPADASDVPRMVADKLARRCWSVTRDDLRQEAEAAALHASTHYDPAKGDIRGYLYRSIARHLTNYMWEAGSPVSYKHRRNELRATAAVDIDKAHSIADEADVGGQVEQAMWRAQVMDRCVVIVGDDAALVIPCLFDDETPLAVSKARRVPLLRVLDALGKAHELISEDSVMRDLYSEMP